MVTILNGKVVCSANCSDLNDIALATDYLFLLQAFIFKKMARPLFLTR